MKRKQPSNIITAFHLGRHPFRFNKKFVMDLHSLTHFFGSALLCCLFACLAFICNTARPELWGAGIALYLGILWEIGDGFKPLWYENPFSDWRDHLLRADGFSWSDILFDTWGVLIGIIILQQFFSM
jgi:hypothetical protein